MTVKKRGRPAFKPTPAIRRKVEQCVFGGMPKTEIAAGLGIDENTLRKHFEHELHIGLSRRRVEVLDLLFSAARKGNVTAQKKLEEMGARAAAEANFHDRPENEPRQADAVSKAPKLGKKESQQIEAENAGLGTDWGDDLHIGAGGRLPN
ncbi:MAG: IS1 family transposase [Dechloromonas sp.]|nr:IS1 family transposase [Dechloromonas sp.]